MAVKIRYKANGMKRSVASFVARKLVANGIATYADAPQQAAPATPAPSAPFVPVDPQPPAAIEAEPVAEPVAETEEVAAEQDATDEPVEISPRTGKPKRQYNRRDMQAED